jgi:Flp pilus assembly protein TadG
MRRVDHILRREDGYMTLFGLFILVCSLVIGGLALDVTNAYRVRTHLQVAGDAAAHAALVVRETRTATEAITTALDVANVHLPTERYGDTLRDSDIQFGYWDAISEVFTTDANSRDAVLVDTGRSADRLNSVGTYFLKFAGIDTWNVRRQSVFETYRPTCFREGIVGQDVVDVTTNNIYKAGFCIHSNTLVSLNTANTFEQGTVVSMPDKRDIDMPTDGFAANPGLEAALRDGSYQLRILQRVNDIIAGVRDPDSVYFRDYIVSGATEIALWRNDKLDDTKFTSGRIHTITCTSSSQSAKIHAGTVLSQVVIWTNCKLMFGENVRLEDVVVVNESQDATSFNGASGIQIGRDDNCATGGGAQLVTRGGINFPQYLKMYGGQMLAVGDISFTSDADGIQGASIIAGGRVDGTSDSVMAFCGGAGMEDNFEADYFRLAR